MDIYSEEYRAYTQHIIDKFGSQFKPTALIIRQHDVTGLLYFHKTHRLNQMHKYTGSGVHWRNHLKTHGNTSTVLWYCIYYDVESLVDAAVSISLLYSIALSQSWANMIIEDGISLTRKGYVPTPEELQRLRTRNIGRKQPAEERAARARKGTNNGMYGVHRTGSDAPRFGIKLSDEGKAKISAKMKARVPVTCPHCNKSCDPANAKRHHFDRCKAKPGI